MPSPWVALEPATDRRRLATVLRRAHALTLKAGAPPPMLREVVAGSWRRAVADGVDPEGPAPRMLDEGATAARLRKHVLAAALERIKPRLFDVTRDGGQLAVLSDADGLLLWSDGTPRMLDAAARPRFLPGHSCNEHHVGTNAIGTALALDHAVQIFSAEHFPVLLHGWTCAAAPIHDPVTGETIGALNLSGPLRSCHPDGVGLVSALARTLEFELVNETAMREDRLRGQYRLSRLAGDDGESLLVSASGRILVSRRPEWIGARIALPDRGGEGTLPDGTIARWQTFGDGHLVRPLVPHGQVSARPRVAIAALGSRRVALTIDGRRVALSPRHSEIVVLLAHHPDGLSTSELIDRLYAEPVGPASVRGELTRLRRLLGPVVAHRPYRIDAEIDGGLDHLLPASAAPGIVSARLDAAFLQRPPAG